MKAFFWFLVLFFLTSCAEMQAVVPGLAPTPTPAPTRTRPASVSTETPLPTVPNTNTPRAALTDVRLVCVESLNVRTGPDHSGPVVDWLREGQRVQVAIIQNGWGYIEDASGWVNLVYLCGEGN